MISRCINFFYSQEKYLAYRGLRKFSILERESGDSTGRLELTPVEICRRFYVNNCITEFSSQPPGKNSRRRIVSQVPTVLERPRRGNRDSGPRAPERDERKGRWRKQTMEDKTILPSSGVLAVLGNSRGITRHAE